MAAWGYISFKESMQSSKSDWAKTWKAKELQLQKREAGKIPSSISFEKLQMKYRLLHNGREQTDADRKWY